MSRQPYYELNPEIYNAPVQASQALENCALEPTLMELIYLRVSQINGCAFCLEMYSKALRKSGVAQAKLDALAGWRVNHHFSEQGYAALAQAESVTQIATTHAEDDVCLPLLDHFSAKEISDLTLAISLMNCFNRLAVGMRMWFCAAGWRHKCLIQPGKYFPVGRIRRDAPSSGNLR